MAYTSIDDPTIYFNTKLWTGNGSTGTGQTGIGFQPDWIWIKARAGTQGAQSHNLFDSVRGEGKYLFSDSNDAESTDTNRLTSFDSDGFTVGSNNAVNASSTTYVAWNWKAGGSSSSNSDGSISSNVSANTTSGFSVVSYTGSGSNATIGHGLSAVPKLIITKRYDGATENWGIYHASTGNTKYLFLNKTFAEGSSSAYWNDTTPTSSVFSIGTNDVVNTSSGEYIAYCFAEKQGFSKFGTYTANGNADGPFIYTGFRPAWVMIRRTDSAQQWGIVDSKRDVDNPAQHHLFAEATQAEGGASSYNNFDLLSNGIKMRSNDQWTNASGGTYVYMAFAESPFVNSNGVPNNAR